MLQFAIDNYFMKFLLVFLFFSCYNLPWRRQFLIVDSKQILQIYKEVQRNPYVSKTLKISSLKKSQNGKRPNSISIEDAFFGDSGKGSVVAKLNHLLGKKKRLFSLRYNGGGNAGHETFLNGKKIVTHQLPMGIVQENAVAIMTRGMLIHPEDLLTEIDTIKKEFGGKLLGKLIIDERALLGLDTHRAYERVLNTVTTGGRGSTGRGIGPGYASLYERISVTIKDLLSHDWKDRLSNHYRLYKMMIRGFGKKYDLSQIEVVRLDGNLKKVESEKEFIKRLSAARLQIKQYVNSQVYSLLMAAWRDPKIPVTIEGAQGAGLDPLHGVYPDVTASRPMSRSINDSTYNIILPEEIILRTAVMKTTYLSSVGQRKLPTIKDEAYEKWIQSTFDERGRSTGRLRDIYAVSIPIAQYLKRASGYDYLVATHLDAARADMPIRVITHYTDKYTGDEKPYFPYQDYLNTLKANSVEFQGWDGELIKKVKSGSDLPKQTKLYLSFLGRSIAPVCFATTGSDIKDHISYLPGI